MDVLCYQSPLPAHRIAAGSFVDRNPNMSYLAFSRDRHAVMIDAGSDLEAILRDIHNFGLHLEAILLTHHHHDHTFPLARWLQEIPVLPVGIHAACLNVLASQGIAHAFPLSEGTTITVGQDRLRVLETPGHTSDSLCFWDGEGKNLFSGDALFGGGIGCSDYGRGGNRNIFYETLVRLMLEMPSAVRLYPGHFSEHLKRLPPYNLDEEKKTNPYLLNVIRGKRSNFDRALKYFSTEFETADVVMLDENSLDAVCRLEKEIWIPELQASREVILNRLKHGHRLLAVREDKELAGMLGWCYSPFSMADDATAFPRTFREFSNCKSCHLKTARSAFIYNLGVKPETRRKGTGSLMLQEAFSTIRKDGISQVFIDSRLPSYNGSIDSTQEYVLQAPEFRQAVDGYFMTGELPEKRIFRLDPAVGFYMKNGLFPWIILRDFIGDMPSGDMRVICYADINTDKRISLNGTDAE